jgi:hypothetical protein
MPERMGELLLTRTGSAKRRETGRGKLVSDKTIRYTNRNANKAKLPERIIQYFKQEEYETQTAEGFHEIIIQARKESILKDLTMVDRCLTILVQGQPDDFTVTVGIGRWFQDNLTKENVEAIIHFGLFVPVDIPAAIWNENFESTIIKNIDLIVEGKWNQK